MASVAWRKPSADPIATDDNSWLCCVARSSTRPEASYPGAEQRSAGTLQSNSFKTIVAKSGSRSAEEVNWVPRVAST